MAFNPLECVCVINNTSAITGKGNISSKLSVSPAVASVSCNSSSAIQTSMTVLRANSASVNASSSIKAKLSAVTANRKTMQCAGYILNGLSVNYRPKAFVSGKAVFNSKAEKIAGQFGDFDCLQKLFPTGDFLVSGFMAHNESPPLYQYVDEGVCTGKYGTAFAQDNMLVANDADYIQPSSVVTSGNFRYVAKVDRPFVRPEHSTFKVRAKAPMSNRETTTPPRYTFKNIEFKDPNGNLIIKYNDIKLFGDNHFATYSSLPENNITNLNDWNPQFPSLHEGSGYTLGFTVFAENLADPFDTGFNTGFEEYYRSPNPSGQLVDTIKISAFEICNSGGYGPRMTDYVNIYMEVDRIGRRLEKIIRPIGMPMYPKITEIWPTASSVWTSNYGLDNTTKCGIIEIVKGLRDDSETNYITMSSTSPINDSGRLLVKFGHAGGPINEVTKGAFNCAFDQSICGMWVEPSGAFNTLNKEYSHFDDNFFTVETVSLKVLARKAPGSRNYALDVVGYSNDRLLNLTNPSGGFLQNIEGSGTLPVVLTIYPSEDLALGGSTLSERFGESVDFLDPSGGDHYLLSTTPVISSTTFRWYEIPLKIYPDNVLLGSSRDYSMSSLFEQLYLDIYPIPSGAEIASMQLLVRYAPQNGLNMISQGGELLGRFNNSLFPSARQVNDEIINTGSGYAPCSLIQNIPHAYTAGATLKSNYSRRWRGMEGLVQGAFDPDQFGFAFNNPLLDQPFLHTYYNFENIVGNTIYPQQGSGTAAIVSSLPVSKYKNLGWRFINDTIFNSELPGYSGLYRTLDWTSLNSGVSNFQSHLLYGKLTDAFVGAVKLSGVNSYVKSNNINIGASGFAAFIRFSPGPNMSGVNYNLWNSGCLFAKHKDAVMQFGLRYASGKLVGFCRDSGNAYVSVTDTQAYNDNLYPLSVMLTYNDNESKRLKLYVNNERDPSLPRLRATSSTFDILSGSGDLYIGYAPTSGVGFNGFVTEFGLSDVGNVVESGADLTFKETTADTYFNNHHMHWWASGQSYTADSFKLHEYIDENTVNDWSVGDFKVCQFGPAFSSLSLRTGRDLIAFSILNSGTPYSSFVNKAFPSTTESGVLKYTVNSGVSYHTQIENDFLRFNLSDTDTSFYSNYPRITKNVTNGYKFSERAIVVETILEHTSSGNISWGPCDAIGPKLIVSLYTRTKEPVWQTIEPNWGLINRSIHYLEPSSCFVKLNSTFNYNDYVDDSEQWSTFPREPYLTEFSEKYYSTDIDKMFLQYDLVYPTGNPYSSRINLHSAHVRLDDAFMNLTKTNSSLNLLASSAYINTEQLNLLLDARLVESEELNLYLLGPIQFQSSGLPLWMSGTLLAPATMNLTTFSSISGFNFVNLYASGSPSIPIYSDSGSFNLHMYGKAIIDSVSGDYLGLSLTSFNTQTSYIPEPNILNLFAFGASGVTEVRSHLPIFVLSDIDSYGGSPSGMLNITMLANAAQFSRYVSNSLNLFTFSNKPEQKMNLVLWNERLAEQSSETLNLTTINFYSDRSSYANWYNYNYGVDIDLDDEVYASVPANDEIRGVNLIGYGACDSDSPNKAIDPPLVTHDTVWREEACNDGGIFRAINTFNKAGYSGQYYGIRKYTDLVPNTAYNTTLRVTTGSTDAIPVPNEWEEWEYGTNSGVTFDNVKLVADSPSGVTRAANDQFGYSVAVRKDLLAIGTPYKSILDESGVLIPRAGSISLYRRGVDVPGEQASWAFEDELVLPSGYRRDYIEETIENLLCYPNNVSPQFCVSGQKWNIGQEGRELGYSLAIANSGVEVVVAGAPGAQWSRSFENVVVSGVPVCMMVFTDKFIYDQAQLATLGSIANKWDLLYKYFAAPWPQGFQPKLDIKVIICQLAFSDQQKPLISPTESWFYHTYLERLDDPTISNPYDGMLSGVMQTFLRAFPRNTALVDKNIPAILGVFEDNSPSTTYKAAFKPVVDAFKSFYTNYSYASGVVSAVNLSALSGYINTISDRSEDWLSASVTLLNETLDYNNLIAVDALKYVTSGVGQQFARSDSYEFQIPPPSGGRVYVFEKENGEFNLVQAIKSPDEAVTLSRYGAQFNDRFGHSVSISEDASTITIGSPFSSQACQIYNRDEQENARMFAKIRDWAVFRGLTSSVNLYDSLLSLGADIAQKETYYALSQSNKFLLRTDSQFWSANGGVINLYEKIFNYSHSDIMYTGTWQFIAEEFAGMSRLGYSTDVNNDGTIAVFGAPTDSFNEFDDTNIWYDKTYNNTWASYTNAGAVRVFESRSYYPHNLAVEFYKFGNLDRNSHPDLAASGYYDQMGIYLDPLGVDFVRTQFSEIEIPQEAGLAFIITPEIDAASDEIIDNIKDWLALGDRTLVLVGNDPVWEDNGRYNRSNQIINKILDKLGSRMRLHPARNQYESLPNCVTSEEVNDNRYNVVPSFVPEYSHPTYIYGSNMFAKGVADIRIDVSKDGLENLLIKSPSCDDTNPTCELPIANLGDLRAEWNASCQIEAGTQTIEVPYKENWPFHFANTNPAQNCSNYPASPAPLINRPNQDPRPILTAAEWTGGETIVIPARSGFYAVSTPIYEDVTINTPYWEFAENHVSGVQFSVFENDNSQPSGVFNSFEYGRFIDPDTLNGRDGLLQAIGETYYLTPVRKIRKVDDYHTIVAELDNVFMFASLAPENEVNLGYSRNTENTNNDENIYFYNNLVKQLCNTPGYIVQLGGWTGRTSFVNAYANSKLLLCLEAHGHAVVENFTGALSPSYNIVWIANPIGRPSETQISEIRSWMTNPGTKLVITYTSDLSIAANVSYICDQLDLSMRPHYSESQGEYLLANLFNTTRFGNQQIDSTKEIVYGCSTGYTWLNSVDSTAVSSLSLVGSSSIDQNFIPIQGGNKVVYYDKDLNEIYWENPSAWKIDALSTTTFSTIPGSGYRIFIDWVAESTTERYSISAYADKVSGPDPIDTTPRNSIIADLDGSLPTTVRTTSIDVKAPLDYLEMKFDTRRHFRIPDVDFVPKTPRVIAVSGYLLPVEEKFRTFTDRVLVGYNTTLVPWYEPERIITIPPQLRPIMTDSAKYCNNGCPGRLIEDGPIIVAEEYENFSTFTNGASRSRIVLISDSTLIQGQCPHYRDESFSTNQAFIRSLYPDSPVGVVGKQFAFTQKLISPERGSPAKYFSMSGINALVSNFGLAGVVGNTTSYTSEENNYDPATLYRPADPITEEQRQTEIKYFGNTIISQFGLYPRFSGQYIDNKIQGGIPQILKSTGRDHLESSGYKGDLFGFSVAIHDNKLMVGTPYNGFVGDPSGWVYSSGSLKLDGQGGAGSTFYFERTGRGQNSVTEFLPWEFVQKIKPSNVLPNDQFGAAIDMDADFVAIGTPGHDYKTTHQHIYAGSAAFIRKEFNAEFDIPLHTFNNSGGLNIQDIGAVFTYQNKIIDWPSRTKEWQIAERINASGYNSPQTADLFGRSVSIDRVGRGDADYTLAVGSPTHDYPTSGNHITGTLSNAGAAYVYDAMLRDQIASIPNSGSWIGARVFGDNNGQYLTIKVNQNTTGGPQSYDVQGLVFTNDQGEIFLEGSGFDPSVRGFIAHRPYVEFVRGDLAFGIPVNDSLMLVTSGEPPTQSEALNLSMLGPDSAFVYNTMNLATSSWSQIQVGSGNPPFNLVTSGNVGIPFSGGLNLVTSGNTTSSTQINLRIRGK